MCTHITEAEIIERLKSKDGKLAYKIDCEYSVFSLNFSYEEKENQKDEEDSSDSDDSDEETDEPGVNSNFLSTVSAYQHGLKDKENILEESNIQKANTKATFLQQEFSRHGNKPTSIKSWLKENNLMSVLFFSSKTFSLNVY